MNKFETERVKYLISQAEKQTYVNLNKGDAVILKRLLEPVKMTYVGIVPEGTGTTLTLVEELDDEFNHSFQEMLDKVNKGEKL